MTSEEVLVKQAQQGDKAAFERLYNMHHEAIFSYIYYRVGNAQQAEDLTGDVFVKMVDKIDTFTSGTRPFLAWLYTVAGNLVRDTMRRQQKIDWVPLDERDSDEEAKVLKTVDKKLTEEQLVEAMTQLTEEQRQVILLRFVEGRTAPAVAELIGKTVTSVKALQRRGIGALRRQLVERGIYV